jgi:hypothetical protein
MSRSLALPRLTSRSARTLLLGTALGFTLPVASIAGEAAGPGSVFPTIETAALDALAFAAEQQAGARRELGGTIVVSRGGYTYEPPRQGDRAGVTLVLGARDVAWYYTHGPRSEHAENVANERLSARDRRMVDRVDPQHRALFVRTPSGRVLRYGDGRLAVVTPKPLKVAKAEE